MKVILLFYLAFWLACASSLILNNVDVCSKRSWSNRNPSYHVLSAIGGGTGKMWDKGSSPPNSNSNANVTPSPRTFASYVIYKSKGAASVKVIPPSFTPVSGTASRIVDKHGGLLFELASSTSPREYDWQKKGTFLLDPTECGELIVMDRSVGAEFFHDPNLNDATKSGQITKRMTWKPSQDSRGMFLSLQVSDKSQSAPQTASTSSFSIPVTWAELEVLRSVCRYALPMMLGFNEVWSNPPLGMGDGTMPPPPPVAPIYYDRQ